MFPCVIFLCFSASTMCYSSSPYLKDIAWHFSRISSRQKGFLCLNLWNVYFLFFYIKRRQHKNLSFFEIWPIRISSILIIFVFKFRCTHTGFPLCRTHEIIVVISTIVFRSINVVTLWKSDKPFLKVVELMNSDILLVRMKLQMLYSKQIISIPAGNLWLLITFSGKFSFTKRIIPPPNLFLSLRNRLYPSAWNWVF